MKKRITVKRYRLDGSGTWYWGYPRGRKFQRKYVYRSKRAKHLFIDIRL